MCNELSCLSKRAVAKENQVEQARQVSSTSLYADNSAIELIANLNIDDGKYIPHPAIMAQLRRHQLSNLLTQTPAAPPSSAKKMCAAYVVFAGAQPGIYEDWCLLTFPTLIVLHSSTHRLCLQMSALHHRPILRTSICSARLWIPFREFCTTQPFP